MNIDAAAPRAGYHDAASCRLDEFVALTARRVDPRDIPSAETVASNVPVYDAAALATALAAPEERMALMAEWAGILRYGAGAFVLRGACGDPDAIDAATAVYDEIIAREKAGAGGGADHFAAAGSNDRIWNSLQKLALEAPASVFVRYFACPAVDAACEAWLGPELPDDGAGQPGAPRRSRRSRPTATTIWGSRPPRSAAMYPAFMCTT